MTTRCLVTAFVVFAAMTARASAQDSRQLAQAAASDAALSEARRLVANGDTANAVRLLRDATAKDPDNGPLWYEYGALLSEQTRYAWRRFVMPAGVPQKIIAAESSLARATRLSPDSLQYAIAYGKHLFGTNATSRRRAEDVQRNAIDKYEEGGADSLLIADAADQVGILQWRRFETLIGRGAPTWSTSGGSIFLNRKAMVDYFRENYRPPEVMYGLALYTDVLEYFRFARMTNPDNEWYFRHEMMVLAEGRRWSEMESVARQRIRERPAQPWPWLVLGLAEQRRGRQVPAQAAFDSGFVRLPEADRQRLQSIGKLLPLPKTKWYDSLSVDEKSALGELFWNTANPSLLLPTNPLLAEFRARVIYSELRFTDDERGIPGANSDKAAIYIRYGPPDAVLEGVWAPGQSHLVSMDYFQSWIYYNDMLIFAFTQNRGYGTAFQTSGSRTYFESIVIDRPVSWANMPTLRYRVDTINTQVARFRSTGDSMDVALFAAFRPGALRRNSPVDTSAIRHGVFFVDALGRTLTQSTSTMTSNERDSLRIESRSYFLRTTARSTAVRTEALEPDLMQVARSVNDISGFTTHGFGTSDLLIADSVRAPSRSGERWTGYAIAPVVGGIVKRGAPIGLLWETYEPASQDGSGKLRFAIVVQRETDRGLIALGGRVIGGVREALGNRTFNRVGITYERAFQSEPVVVDHLMLELGRLEPGRYRITLTVTDLVGNSTVSRMQRFMIVP